MLVYGCRCAPIDIGNLPASADADFILDYALLMFNRFTRGTTIANNGALTPEFWADAARVIQTPARIFEVRREEPTLLTPGETAVVDELRTSYPSLTLGWYHVPRAIIH